MYKVKRSEFYDLKSALALAKALDYKCNINELELGGHLEIGVNYVL